MIKNENSSSALAAVCKDRIFWFAIALGLADGCVQAWR
jgi:hypothetical protein